jgi:hypothetical protein
MLSLDRIRQSRRMGPWRRKRRNPFQQKAQQTSEWWKRLILIFTVADFYGVWLIQNSTVPFNVLRKYDGFRQGNDITLQRCSKDNEVHYKAYVGLGSPHIYYFNALGGELGTYFLTDAPSPRSELPPPVNTTGYNCVSIASSWYRHY